MKRAILVLALGILALLIAGCGPVASPTTTTVDTTTTTAAAELAQHDNRATCTGLLVIGSCNIVALQHQTTTRPTTPARAAVDGLTLTDTFVKAFIIALLSTALFCLLIGGIRWIFGDAETF